jgi:hypothetical protein
VTKQHTFLDHARELHWDRVFRMLDKRPTLVNVQPAGRWQHPRHPRCEVLVCLQLATLDTLEQGCKTRSNKSAKHTRTRVQTTL